MVNNSALGKFGIMYDREKVVDPRLLQKTPQIQTGFDVSGKQPISAIGNTEYYRNRNLPTGYGNAIGMSNGSAENKQGVTYPEQANPAIDTSWAKPENLSRFSDGSLAIPDNGAIRLARGGDKPVYGETHGSGYIKYGNDKPVGFSGPATGGFARPSTADANVAFESGVSQNISDLYNRQQNEALKQRQMDVMGMLGDAARSGSATRMAALAPLMQSMSGVQPYDYSTQNLHQEQSRLAGPSALGDINLKNAQAGYYGGRNAAELGASRLKALTDRDKGSGKQSMSQKDVMDFVLKIKELEQTDKEGAAQMRAQLEAMMKG